MTMENLDDFFSLIGEEKKKKELKKLSEEKRKEEERKELLKQVKVFEDFFGPSKKKEDKKEKTVSKEVKKDTSSSENQESNIFISELERRLKKLKSPSYKSIDRLMKSIAKKYSITPKELHDKFKAEHNQIPDEWVKQFHVKEEIKEEKNIDPKIQKSLDILKKLERTDDEITEETDPELRALKTQVESMRKQIESVIKTVTAQGGGGEVRLEFLDDVDRDSAKIDGRVLTYDSSAGIWTGGVGGSGGGGATRFADLTDVSVPSEQRFLVYNPDAGRVIGTTIGSNLVGIVTEIVAGTNISISTSFGSVTVSAATSITIEDAQSLVLDAHNNNVGYALTIGTPVYQTGYNSGQNRIDIEQALASSSTTMPAKGLTSSTINNNNNGQIIVQGELEGIDTSSFEVGDELYVGVNGGLTATRPSGDNDLVQKIAVVLKKSNNGAVLVYGAGRTNDVPNTISIGGSITGGAFYGDGSNLTGITVGAAGTWAVSNVGIYTTKNVGIGTTARADEALFVEGDARITGVLTIGQSSITIDGTENELKVGSGVTIHNSGLIEATDYKGYGGTLTGVVTSIVVNNLTATQHLGIVTLTGLGNTQFTQSDHLTVSGIATLGVVTVTQVFSSGIITATEFSGDGSSLTGVVTTLSGADGSVLSGIVTSITGGDNISISGSTGNVTITGLANTSNINADTLIVSGVSTLGVVTGATYYGDGSNLTGVANTSNVNANTLVVTGVSTLGIVTGATYYGDGSNLTGIASAVSDLTNDTGFITNDVTGNLSVSGNVTIGGTLTYEDVTEIDSIGIITARRGIVVTGVTTSTSFEGSGSNLTGIATNIIAGDNITVSQDGGAFTITSSAGIVTDGMSIGLGTPTDSDLVTPGALNTFTNTTKVTDSIDDLNELMFNVIRNTAVTEVDFVGSPRAGGSPLGVALTITHSGNANRYDIDWGDGTTDTASTLAEVSHTYSQPSGGTNTVTVTAYNNTGVGAGHSFTTVKADFVVVYTPDPGIGFSMFSAVSGGSSISLWDSGSTVYLENSTSNVTGFAVTYSLDWGDGTDAFISANTEPGGVGGGRTIHTYTNTAETDTEYTVELELSSHPAANPSVIPVTGSQTFRVYSTHTPSFTTSDIVGINSSSNSGFPVVFSNTTEDTIGNFTTFGNTYTWTWGDGTTNDVNVGSSAAGDNDVDISHTFALTSSEQEVGTSKTFAVNLRAITNHTSSPFITANTIITVEPEVRSIFTGVATVTSDRTGDNAQDLYDGEDIFGRNRRVGIFTNTSHNGEDYVYAWGDGSSNDTVADNLSVGGTTTPIYHTFQGSTGNKTVTLTANGTPGTLVQNGKTSTVTMQLNAIPSAPTSIDTVDLSLSTSSQGTSPKLCANFTDNTSGSGLNAGSDVTRYISTTPIVTNSISDINGSHTGILTALYNGSADGQKTFSTSTGETGTFTSLVISSEGDAHDEISSSTYPTGFFHCFTANISKALSDIDTGLNDFGMVHSTGSTGLTTFVKDDLNSTPTLVQGTYSEGTGGTKRYISGVPYYNTGSPSLTLSGVEVTNFMGQTYQNTASPVQVRPGENQESTTADAIGNVNFSYSDVDGSTSYLSGGIPIANTGVGVAYTFGNLTVPITTSSVRTIQKLRHRARNANGMGSYRTNDTIVQVHTVAQSGINETAIAVSDSLGSGFDDDGVRIFDFSSETTDNPSFNGSTNFYTNNLYSESSDPGVSGTKESTVRLGVLEHNVVDYSSGYLPVGPDRSGDTGTQYFTFAFRRTVVANFDINITSSGIAGLWIAAPGTNIDDASGINGWLRADSTYGGSGTPGSDTANGGNGSDGCAFTSGDRIATSTSLSGGYTMTLGDQNMSDATGNVVLVRIALTSGQSVTSLSVGVAA